MFNSTVLLCSMKTRNVTSKEWLVPSQSEDASRTGGSQQRTLAHVEEKIKAYKLR